MATFSERIALLRQKLNITQQELAISLNVSKRTLGGFENGHHSPSVDFLINIKKLYPKLSIDWLLLGEGEMWEKEKPAGSESIRVENNQIGNNVNVQQLLGGCEKEVARLKREIQLLEEINQLLRQKNQ
jgi:transcriptional regulator with XRE-family HTH domain